MAILLRNGAIFLHIPKTGGSFVTSALQELDAIQRPLGHIHGGQEIARLLAGRAPTASLLVRSLKSRVPVNLKRRSRSLARASWLEQPRQQGTSSSPFTFCFVREPLSWYESFWRYMVARAGSDWSNEPDLKGWHPCAPLASIGSDNFADFMSGVVEQQPGFVTLLYGRYLADGVDFIGRQENLVDDLSRVLGCLEVEHSYETLRAVGRVNESVGTTADWPADIRAEVSRLEYSAAVRLGYAA